MADDQPERHPTSPLAVQFLTTEHFTLQTERTSATNEVLGRLQLYMSVLSSAIISLALIGEVSHFGRAFRAFADILLPTVYVFGLITTGRMQQLWVAWYRATMGMARIRHFCLEVAPELEPYLVMPTADDSSTVLGGSGIVPRHRFVTGLFTAPAAVTLVNSIVVGVFAGILASIRFGAALVGLAGGLAFLVSFVALFARSRKELFRNLDLMEARFPKADAVPFLRPPGPASGRGPA